MLLNDLTIHSFRSMKDVHLPKLSPVNILVGPNNCGKTSVLEAVALLLRPADAKTWINVIRFRDQDLPLQAGVISLMVPGMSLDSANHGHSRIAGSFENEGLRNLRFFCTAMGSAITLIVQPADRELTKGVFYKTKLKSKEFDDEHTPDAKDLAGRVASLVSPVAHRSSQLYMNLLSATLDSGHLQLIEDLLKSFDPNIRAIDISLTPGREGIRLSHETRRAADMSSFGDGMRRSAFLAMALAQAKGGVLLIDELEAGLHKSMLDMVLGFLVEAAKKLDVQIIATTHSLETVDALIDVVEAQQVDLSAYYLRRRDAGGHDCRHYDLKRIAELREAGLDLR